MSDADADGTDALRDLIARARNDGAAPERLAAVRARLEAQLGPLDRPPSPPAPAISAKVALGVAAMAAVIAVGVWLGTRGDDGSATGLELDAPALRSDPPGEPSPAPAVPSVAEPVAEEGTEEPSTEEATPAPIVAVEEEAPRIERARRVTPEPDPIAPEPSVEDSASMLREEIALLDRALRARESGDPARATAALEEHRARFPSGRLQPERDRMLSELATSGVPTTP